MGLTNDDYLYFKNVFDNAGALDRIVSFVNTTEDPPVEDCWCLTWHLPLPNISQLTKMKMSGSAYRYDTLC
jgi:vacuolar-type H+-ATPase subunit B/Vma2